MADDGPPPWANRTYTTPPTGGTSSAPPASTGIPGASTYSTPTGGRQPFTVPPPQSFGSRLYDVANNFVTGVGIGELDPAAGIGLDLREREGLKMAETTTPGKIGRVVGNIVNPTWELFGPLRGAVAAYRYGNPIMRGLAQLAERATEGATAGAVMPGEDRAKQAGWGAGISAILGIPGAAVRAFGFPSLRAAAQAAEREIPGVRSIFNAARTLSVPDFNRAWYKYVLEPIGGKVPIFASREAMADVERQVGDAINRSTKGMTLDTALNASARNNLALQKIQSNSNLMSTGNASNAYTSIIREIYEDPLHYSGGKLDADQLQAVTSNLQAQIRAIDPGNEANRGLRRELERFRVALFDNASGGDKVGWRSARAAWQKFAIARDGSTNTPYGLFTPDSISAELGYRYPLQAPSGRAPHQPIAQTGQQALVFPGRAAAQQIAGTKPTLPRVGANIPVGTAAATQEQAPP